MCKTSTLLRFVKEIRQKLVEERQVFFSSRFFLLNIKKFKVFDQVVFDSFFSPKLYQDGTGFKVVVTGHYITGYISEDEHTRKKKWTLKFTDRCGSRTM